jgi:tellurite resistance protein
MSWLPRVPVSLFAIVLGVMGLGLAWREAVAARGVAAWPGGLLVAAGTGVWAVLLVLYLLKWLLAREAAVREIRHPVQGCFGGLAGVSTMLAGLGVLPEWRAVGLALILPGMGWALGYAVWCTGSLWRGGRDVAGMTAAAYLPMGAGGFVSTIACAGLGWHDWAVLAFGAAAFSSLSIESVLLHRLYHAAPLHPALRPTLGITLAQPTVACLSYLIVFGQPDIFAQSLLGYGLYQAAVLARLLPWVWRGGFSAGWWGYSFGLAALANAALRLAGANAAWAVLAPVLFAAAVVLILALMGGTLVLLVRGRLLPAG